MTSSSKALRHTLGKFATGITVVTCTSADGRAHGFTANSFNSVSLEPPLILWSIANHSGSFSAYTNATHFAVHILRDTQEHLSQNFAKTDHKSFDGVDYTLSDDGVPILPDTLARLDCETWQVHEAGDHHIIVGRVLQHQADDGDPLMYFSGGYARF